MAANLRLTAARDETEDFLAVTAHEHHSPITAMTGAADILLEHWDDLDGAERVETLQNLTRSGSRLNRLLDDLLTVSRLEAGSIEFKPENVPLAGVIAEAVSEVTDLSDVVEVTGAEGLIVLADPIRVVQILTNLLSNAARYGQPPITVAARQQGDTVEVRVGDAGRESPRISGPGCSRSSPGAEAAETGALASGSSVRALARGQGGDAWYEDDAPGTCFAVVLPTWGHQVRLD
ncbi:MAG: sensor histidine kinase [Acidimicrobiia bacterium]